MRNRGFFIVFEGIDGSGKSTHIKLLENKFKQKGFQVCLTKEYTDNPIGKLIGSYAVGGERSLSPETEALLFAADRREHTNEINRILNQNKTVISDRYIHSSLAYQGALGLSLEWIRTLNRFALKPDLVLFLDIDPTSSLKRLKQREQTVFEEADYLKLVREIYLKFVKEGSIVKVNAEKSIDEIQHVITSHVEKLITPEQHLTQI
jgi:dTMP kinase